ncbi:hypothetical protein CLV24_104167 [Pontibacter ummariensis]|uniref:Uncharacterized protein n=2 Tax=Pontibacter ummariensis TaxID=1610492 RepID=A0A239DCK3_9BACT|nr:hypothetical protein CLV24_104167 [Pontibacter ummariensis]SNS30027.1 hypothetical protein SAMN06296052_104166 [Pontibacter ummariensis]
MTYLYEEGLIEGLEVDYMGVDLPEETEEPEEEAAKLRQLTAEPVPVETEWLPAEGELKRRELPRGFFLGSVRYRAYDGQLKHATKVLYGQLKDVYEYRAGRMARVGKDQTITHYMPLPGAVIAQ